jgi:hypothetical protein
MLRRFEQGGNYFPSFSISAIAAAGARTLAPEIM